MANWNQVTEERYWEMLGCLPPEVMTGMGFLVGEPMSHNAAGRPVFSAFAQWQGKFYEAKECLTVAEFKAITPEQFEQEVAADETA